MSDTDTDPETTWAFASLAISEVTARLDDSDWRIIDSSAAHITTAAGRRGRIYWDETTPDDEGWAYQLEATEDDPEQSGPLNSFGDLAVFEAATVVSDGAAVGRKREREIAGRIKVRALKEGAPAEHWAGEPPTPKPQVPRSIVDIARAWKAGEALRSGNVSTDGRSMYSWNLRIGRTDGDEKIAIDHRGRSMSTSRHVNAAIQHADKVEQP